MSDTDFLDRLDWDKLTSEVVKKIGYLRYASNSFDDVDSRHIIRRDLILPHLDLLRRFCEAITEDGE